MARTANRGITQAHGSLPVLHAMANLSLLGHNLQHKSLSKEARCFPSSIRCISSSHRSSAMLASPRDASEDDTSYYHKSADHELDHLYDVIVAFVETLEGMDGDVEYSQGVMTIRLGNKGTFVLNKQAPNRQIWVSSPISGPSRFDMTPSGRWHYKRDMRELREMLEKELAELTGREIDLT
jgi:frataxin